MDMYGLPLQILAVHHLAQLLLSAYISSAIIRKNWVNYFVKHHPGLILKYIRKYDY